MKKFRTTMELEIDVYFSEPEKATDFFTNSDWKNYFFKYEKLSEVAQHIAEVFERTPELWKENKFAKHLEGFGYFISNSDGTWSTEQSGFGLIQIGYEMELETTGINEITE